MRRQCIVRTQNESQFWWGGGYAFERTQDTMPIFCVYILKNSQYEAEGIWEGNGQLGQVEGEARAKVWPCGQEWHSCCHCRVGVLNCFEHG